MTISLHSRMKQKRRIKRIARILLCPLLFFIVLILLLYFPPIQNFLREKAVIYASETSGMEIGIRRIDLRFPFNFVVHDVKIVQAADTLFTLDRINARMRILPLLRGKIEIQGVTMQGVNIHLTNQTPGMQLTGNVGQFYIRNNALNIQDKMALISRTELSNTQLRLILSNEFFEKTDTTAMNWRLMLGSFKLKNVSFDIQLPDDSLHLDTHIQTATVTNAETDFDKQLYLLNSLTLKASSINYDVGQMEVKKAFDQSHIALQNIEMELDSLMSRNEEVRALIRNLSMQERSGLRIASTTGQLYANSSRIDIPRFSVSTPHSHIELEAQIPLHAKEKTVKCPLNIRLDASIGKQDVMYFTADLSDSFNGLYPNHPLLIQMIITGNADTVYIPRLSAELPTTFSLTGGGELQNPMNDSIRLGDIHWQMKADNLNFLTRLVSNDHSLAIPPNMILAVKTVIKGTQYDAALRMKDEKGSLNLNAGYNTTTESYYANLNIDALRMDHFLPEDSLYALTATLTAKGEKTDLTSFHAWASLHASITDLQYGRLRFSGINLDSSLKKTVLTAQLTSNNPLLSMNVDAEYHLADRRDNIKVNMDVAQMDLYRMRIIPHPLKTPVAFTMEAEAKRDSIKVSLAAGDMSFRFRSRNSLKQLIEKSIDSADILSKQIKAKRLNHGELRQALPSAGLTIRAGKNNPFRQLLETNNISYQSLAVNFVATPSLGINGRASIDALKIDTLRLDTILLAIKQDTTHLSIRGGIANNGNNPHWVFKSSITGEIRSNDAELLLEYENKKGEKGILLGVNIRPTRNAIQIKFIPEEPIVAFRKFHFSRHNRISIRDNFHVTADVEMLDKDGMGVRIHSLRDTTALQNLDIEIRKIRLAELSSLPYFPQFTGEFSADANYKQTSDFKQISVEAVVKSLTYEQQPIGDMGLGFTWLPNDTDTHYINTYLSCNKEEVLTANGTYRNNEQGHIDAKAELEHFPLQIINAFIPNGMATLSGDIDGEVHATGIPSRPSINGKLILDSVSVDTHQYGARFNFDDRAVQIKDNLLEFDDFAIYTTSNNPFTIKGFINFQNIRRPWADLTMRANNYTLLNARRTRESLLYGKVLVDVNSTIKGPLEALVMRGNMNIRGNTDATYVLTDSPLSVQDRLGDLVTFTSFADTLSHGKEEVQPVSLRGLDVLMTIHIDQAVRLKVDLSADRNSRLELEGGGDLSFQYTSQGNKMLNGRYTLRKGLMRYSFPVIPLKDFNIENGSYVEWAGDITNPHLALKATERIRTSVMREDGSSRMVSFDVSIEIKNRLEDLILNFDLETPDDMTIQNQLTMMSPEERN
ncbi:hypothetical protein EZS27_022411, partial [termite gut metagenome]